MKNWFLGLTLMVGLTWALDAQALEYRVRSGDTLGKIATRFGVSLDALMKANDKRGDLILIGEVLVIPDRDRPATRTQPVTYTVRSGDSLWRLSMRYGVTIAAIMNANDLTSDVIKPKQRLTIPGRVIRTRVETPPLGNPVRKVAAMKVQQWEVEILARIVKGEASGLVPWEGQVAVAAVVLNRVRSRSYPNTIKGVAHQPSQFSCYNPKFRGDLYHGSIPDYAWKAARAALAGQDPTGGSTHYYNPYLVRPRWARSGRLERVRTIGHSRYKRSTTHAFYRPTRRSSAGLAGSIPLQ